MHDEALTRAIRAVGGRAKLASSLGISREAVWQWRRVPAERVLQVEMATDGQVTRHELRPDIYPPDKGA
jgi:DNA-binding transcriptional regulator YdaS (Cro superfamily)